MGLDNNFALALQAQRAGRLGEAEELCRRVLGEKPEDVEALHLLGVIALQTGRGKLAVELMGRVVAVQPDRAAVQGNYGNALMAMGQVDRAIEAYQRVIALAPDWADAYYNLGRALQERGRIAEAVKSFRKVVELRPERAAGYSNLGNALQENGDVTAAITAHRRAIELDPKFAAAYSNLGNALKAAGQAEAAVAAYRCAVGLAPKYAEGHYNLALALEDGGELDTAIAEYRCAVALRPEYGEALSNLGNMLEEKGEWAEAEAVIRRAVAVRPESPEVYNNLGNVLKGQGKLDAALEAYGRAIGLKSDFAAAHSNLGNALKESGALDAAITEYRSAIAIAPDYHQAHSNLVYALLFHPKTDPQMNYREALLWDRAHTRALLPANKPHLNERASERRLRIGYVSGDFRAHVVGQNLIPLLRERGHETCEIYCYSDVRSPDEVTVRFQTYADQWRSIVGMSDGAVAEMVRGDRIDILVDLGLHMGGNRLLVFARRPAPVQVTFAGYPGTTGLQAMDYRLSDPHLEMPGEQEKCYSEKTVCLPDSFWCYDPMEGRDMAVGPLPAARSGHVTFGCLNNFSKINEVVLRMWAGVLRGVPGSRMMILAAEGEHRRRVSAVLGVEGIDSGRVEFISWRPRRAFLETFGRIDLGLDTIPYSGHSTSLESMWMGVPVVTLAGATTVGRAGVSMLENVGMRELIGRSAEEFVGIAVAWAGDLPRLERTRREFAHGMLASPLMDAQKFARNVEAAYRSMWRTWCRGTGGDNSGESRESGWGRKPPIA